MRSKKSCKWCGHELTECSVNSIGHDKGACLGCIGVARRADTIFGGKCSQADHDMESVENGMMDEGEFFQRNPKTVGVVKFEEVIPFYEKSKK